MVVIGGISINTIKLMLSVMLLGMLAAVGAAQDGYGDQAPDFGGDHHNYDGHNSYDGHHHNDWLNPGGYSSTYYWSYPSYYYSSWYPYTYTYYPTYYYTAPVYSTYYYDPVVYNYWDPWWATNAYGMGGASYSYSSSWSWSTYHGGLFF